MTSIGDWAFSDCESLTISLYKNSYAQQYAKDHNIPYAYIGDDTPDEPTVIGSLGDLDGDGKVTSGDALMILRQSVGMENFTSEQTNLADVDGDGKITAGDALAVLRRSVGMNDDNNVGKPIEA